MIGPDRVADDHHDDLAVPRQVIELDVDTDQQPDTDQSEKQAGCAAEIQTVVAAFDSQDDRRRAAAP